MVLATWFGCGLWPWGPGTAGSAGAVLVAWLLVRQAGWPPWMLLVLAAVVTPLGIWASTRAAIIKSTKDPQIVVIDEVLGQWIALAAIPHWSWPWALLAFVLFRLFDMTKPWPVRQLEAWPGGAGIVADDLGAGLYCVAVVRVVLLLGGWFNLK
jgi:phosphatidylglycerophosphatase A